MAESTAPAGSWQALKIIMRYRLKRFANAQGKLFGNSKAKGRKRKGFSVWLLAVMGILYTLAAISQSKAVQDAIWPKVSYEIKTPEGKVFQDAAGVCAETWRFRVGKGQWYTCQKVPPAPHQTITAGLQKVIGVELLLIFIALVCSGISHREITAPEWDLEWLATLPVPLRTLIDARILQRSVLSPLAVLFNWPFCTVFLWKTGLGPWAILQGLGMAAILAFMAACVQVLFDTGLRLITKPSETRNIQAVLAIGFPAALAVAMSPLFQDNRLLVDAATSLPAWTAWTPFELAVSFFTTTDITMGLIKGVVLAAQVMAIYLICSGLLSKLLARGVIAGSGWQSTRQSTPESPTKGTKSSWLKAVPRKELTLVWRDKNYLMQAFVVPIAVLVLQVWLTGGHHRILTGSFGVGAAAAFGCVCYLLMLSAFQVVASEKQSLWLLHSFPVPLRVQFANKIKLWGFVALAICVGLLVLRWVAAPPEGDSDMLKAAAQAAYALLGVPIFALISGSIGVLTTDPLAEDTRKKLSMTATFTIMSLAGFYAFGMFASDATSTITIAVLSALLAIALWQKACQHMPYLLDPAATPKPTVMLADGVMAVLGFFAVQLLVTLIAAYSTVDPDADKVDQISTGIRAVSIGFAVAGGTVFAFAKWRYWRRGTAHQPRFLPPQDVGWLKVIGYALPLAAVAIAVGAGYMELVAANGWFVGNKAGLTLADIAAVPRSLWFLAAVLIAAPLFEEYIFRGLVFGPLVRGSLWATGSSSPAEGSLPPAEGSLQADGSLPATEQQGWSWGWAALASTVLFTLIHPPSSMAPVFVTGLLTAYAAYKTRSLAAPIIIHVLYNIAATYLLPLIHTIV